MKNPVPIATNIPAVIIPEVGTCCDAMIVNMQSPSDFHVQLIHSQYQLHRLAVWQLNIIQCRSLAVKILMH